MLLKVLDDDGDKDDNTGNGTSSKSKLQNMHVPHFPQMSLFLTNLVLPCEDNDGKIIVTYQEPPVSECKNRKTLEVPLQPNLDGLEEIPVIMHQSPMTGYKMGREYDGWFSECFGFPVVLAYTGQNRRQVLGSVNPNNRQDVDATRTGISGSWLSTFTSYVHGG